jgi:hypothetical protein
MKLSSFRQDTQASKEGVVRYFDDEKKVYVRVARLGNAKFESEMRLLLQPYKTFRKSRVPDEVVERLTKEAMARTILLEMVGFEDDAGDITGTVGAPIEDTFENRFKVLSSKNYEEFLEMISGISADWDNFRGEMEAEAEGNSESSASGSGHGGDSASS